KDKVMATTLADETSFMLASNTFVFETGPFNVSQQTIDTSHPSSPPKQLLIIAPTAKGEYPVIVFLHGFTLSTSFYSQLLAHIASHGYIAVAPQLYFMVPQFLPTSGYEEMKSAAAVTDWLSEGLQSVLPKKVNANLLKLALTGHSRGGNTAFSLALGLGGTLCKFSALIGIDPAAGITTGTQVKPNILTKVPRSFNVGIPVLIVGTGLGNVKRGGCLILPCAPDGVNHKEFYNESQAPCYHFVTKDYGHMDMLDDELNIFTKLAACVCKAGQGSKDPMRRCVGGLVVAFLEYYLY
ncbi:hypothetical protein IFM89_002274, partial [Coptis chinensis]